MRISRADAKALGLPLPHAKGRKGTRSHLENSGQGANAVDALRGMCDSAQQWTMEIPGWHPTPLNRLSGHWATRSKLKAADAEQIAIACKVYGVPMANEKRRVRLHLVYAAGERQVDGDASFKSLLDALVKAGALKNDSPAWCAIEQPTTSRGEVRRCFVTVEKV